MLVLTRKKNESIIIDGDIEITITDISEDRVKIGINAPKSVKIFRKELLEEIEDENLRSTQAFNIDIESLNEIIGKSDKK